MASVSDPLAASPTGMGPMAGWRRVLYGAIIFVSAFLLFLVQPLISKSILPWFGGAPGVWTVAMLVFQVLLCLGYLYAHLLSRLRSTALQGTIHVGLIVLAVLTLPILPSAAWKPAGTEDPTWRIAGTLLASIGLPFAVLSTTGPLIQSWFRATEHQGKVPYRLYALSNFGSLLALLAYPFVIEPRWNLRVQSAVWSGLFVLFGVLCSGAALLVARSGRSAVDEANGGERPAAKIPPRQIAAWFVLGMIPSVMLLATTNQLCLDIAPVPFLWVLPLSLYLISFILCFEAERWSRPTAYAVGFVLFASMIALGAGSTQLPYQLTAYLGCLFCVCMFCHGEFAARKPDPRHLTLYYLVLSLAGAAGGIFVGIVAPRVFDRFHELPLCLLLVGGLALAQFRKDFRSPGLPRRMMAATAALGTLAMFAGMGWRMARERTDVLAARRDFFGVLSVVEMLPDFPRSTSRMMSHGQISHGMQYRHPDQRGLATGYFGLESGIGRVLGDPATAGSERPGRRIGVVGLGVGTLASYCGPRDQLRFYELSQNVELLAREYFTYLSDCRGEVEVVLGDARLVLEREAEQGSPLLDVLALDAFSGDSIPSHLLTREALATYLRRMTPAGILAVHFTNRHLDLEPVLADLARHGGLHGVVVEASPRRPEEAASIWAVLSRDPQALARPALEGSRPLSGERPLTWTDDYSSLFAVMKPFHWEGLIPQSSTERSPARAYAAMREEKWEIAADELRQLIESAPGNPAYCVNLADVCRLQDREGDAVTWYRRALAIDDRNARVHHALGTLLAGTDPNAAARHLLTATTQNPSHPEPHVDLGNLLLRHGRPKEAIRAYQAALALQPEHPVATANLKLAEAAIARTPVRGS